MTLFTSSGCNANESAAAREDKQTDKQLTPLERVFVAGAISIVRPFRLYLLSASLRNKNGYLPPSHCLAAAVGNFRYARQPVDDDDDHHHHHADERRSESRLGKPDRYTDPRLIFRDRSCTLASATSDRASRTGGRSRTNWANVGRWGDCSFRKWRANLDWKR